MTLQKFIDFQNQLDEGEYPEYDIPIEFSYNTLNQKIPPNSISAVDQFCQFLVQLYYAYRKIELTMENAEYPNILSDLDFQEKSFMKICLNLNKAKEDYISMDTTDFLKMYPVLKTLFFCYLDYIRYSVQHMTYMDEGNYLPGLVDEIKSWFQKLNTWFPIKKNGEWRNYMHHFIVRSCKFKHAVGMLYRTIKFKDRLIMDINEEREPYIRGREDKILFGFVNMEGAKAGENCDNSKILNLKCPKKCTRDARRWICMKCGEFVRSGLDSLKQKVLVCPCGSKKYREKFLRCVHLCHGLKCKVWISHTETRKMTFEEIIQFSKDRKMNEELDVDIPFFLYFRRLDMEFREMVINNDDNFTDFLTHLYFIYKDIEVKMRKVGYEGIISGFKWGKQSLADVHIQLINAKRNFYGMNRNNFLGMYPIVKTLFLNYIEYIERSIDFENNIDEGDYLPVSVEELQSWLTRLNVWFPVKLNGQWINCMNFFIAAPAGFHQTIEALRKISRFANHMIFQDSTVFEPYIGEENDRKSPFGFVNMENAWPTQTSKKYILLESKCPKQCTKQLKIWICTHCGDFIKLMTSAAGWRLLVCCCGSKKYNDSLFICYHPAHQTQISNRKRSGKESVQPSVPIKRKTNDDMLNEYNSPYSID